ncbi:MAG TPA: hypothetical protein EYP10_13325 [Armatimonadetes bacterium]|nr:hypothetical protein [Armatimonadota bacterium]
MFIWCEVALIESFFNDAKWHMRQLIIARSLLGLAVITTIVKFTFPKATSAMRNAQRIAQYAI